MVLTLVLTAGCFAPFVLVPFEIGGLSRCILSAGWYLESSGMLESGRVNMRRVLVEIHNMATIFNYHQGAE